MASGRPPRIITAAGFTGSLAQHADRLGCSVRALHKRRRTRGLAIEAVIEEAAQYGMRDYTPRLTSEQRLIDQARREGWHWTALQARLPWRNSWTLRSWLRGSAQPIPAISDSLNILDMARAGEGSHASDA